ncbi:MAG: hypothetical protein PHF33_10810 [Candidatus Delongbacteria bacterium]|nr:hypothetical protein [Candidatus Delongbacteria bacterium]MDD4206180.1 hypothetical protein [Candidatus Delongbacteria bacterium]MDY0016346.1 hypothetical protein [Candidatus Delongbacteria bacterium]
MILKPFSMKVGIGYRKFLEQNYFIVLKNNSLKRVNLKGINSISSPNNDEFIELQEEDLIIRRFEDIDIIPVILHNSEKTGITDMLKPRMGQSESESQNDILFSSLGSVFSMEMTDIVSLNELLSQKHRNGIDIIKDTMIFSEKGHLFEKFTANLDNYLKYLRNPSDFGLLKQIKESIEETLKEYDENPFDHFMLGLILMRPTRFYDEKRSAEEFGKCLNIAKEIENVHLTALCSFILAWIAYLSDDSESAVKFSLEAIRLCPTDIPELFYNLSKYYAGRGDAENALRTLNECLEKFDHTYVIKAGIDDDFLNIKDDYEKFITSIRDQEKKYLYGRLKEFGIVFRDDTENQKQEILDEVKPHEEHDNAEN